MRKTYSNTLESVSNYVDSLYSNEASSIEWIRSWAKEEGLPDIHVSAMDGLHLEMMARACGSKKAVEIGTLAGYSGICIARALPKNGKLFTFESEPHHAKIARKIFEKAGLLKKIKIYIGAALMNLKKIESEGPFDFVFIDADKTNYPNYLKWAEKHLRIGGVLAADNTFAFGLIAEKNDIKLGSHTKNVRALRTFNYSLAHHSRFRSTILPTGEGLTFAVRIK